jgi:hypothetical protein
MVLQGGNHPRYTGFVGRMNTILHGYSRPYSDLQRDSTHAACTHVGHMSLHTLLGLLLNVLTVIFT